MHPIKFRAFGKNSKEFLTYVEHGKTKTGLTLKNIQNIEDIDLWDFQQFTWLHDKNWKEIYEGDICLIQDDDDTFPQEYNEEKDEYTNIEKCVMVWRKDWAWFYPKCDGIDNSEGWYWEQLSFEVIWNIYSNPELLNQ